MCSMHGVLTMGIMGFGWLLVNGWSLVPFPPAMITAFMSPAHLPLASDPPLLPRRALFQQDPLYADLAPTHIFAPVFIRPRRAQEMVEATGVVQKAV